MRSRRLRLCVSLTLLCGGCSSTIAVRQPLSENALRQVNDAIGGRSATVILDGAEKPAQVAEVNVGPDSTELLERQSASEADRRTVPTSALRQITVNDRGRGARRGFAIGAPLGAVLGALGGAGAASVGCGVREGRNCDSAAGPVLLGAVGGAVLVGGLGALIGVGVGYSTTIDLRPEGSGK